MRVCVWLSLFGLNIWRSYKELWMMLDEEVMDIIMKNECEGKF